MMKRTRCGELEMLAKRGKDAFVSASFLCAVVASPPFPGAAASSPPFRCLLPSSTSPPLLATSYRRRYLPVSPPPTLSDPLIFVHTTVATRGLRHKTNAGQTQVASRGARREGTRQRRISVCACKEEVAQRRFG